MDLQPLGGKGRPADPSRSTAQRRLHPKPALEASPGPTCSPYPWIPQRWIGPVCPAPRPTKKVLGDVAASRIGPDINPARRNNFPDTQSLALTTFGFVWSCATADAPPAFCLAAGLRQDSCRMQHPVRRGGPLEAWCLVLRHRSPAPFSSTRHTKRVMYRTPTRASPLK